MITVSELRETLKVQVTYTKGLFSTRTIMGAMETKWNGITVKKIGKISSIHICSKHKFQIVLALEDPNYDKWLDIVENLRKS